MNAVNVRPRKWLSFRISEKHEVSRFDVECTYVDIDNITYF